MVRAHFDKKRVNGITKMVCRVCKWAIGEYQSTAMRSHLSKHNAEWQQVIENEKKQEFVVSRKRKMDDTISVQPKVYSIKRTAMSLGFLFR